MLLPILALIAARASALQRAVVPIPARASELQRAVDVHIGAAFDHVVPSTYASFNLDYHYDGEEYPAWKGCSVINMSLTEPNLVYLAKSLSPAVLRVGGSEGDMVFYETPGAPCPPNTTFCLTFARWGEINAFAEATGNKVAFGLNAMAGRLNKTCPLCPWDPTNTAAFLAASKAAGITPYAFEFGNVSPSSLAAGGWPAHPKALTTMRTRRAPRAGADPLCQREPVRQGRAGAARAHQLGVARPRPPQARDQ